jgi:phospholipid/cholesterol/gamma-HCH transport system substrate-binding protein
VTRKLKDGEGTVGKLLTDEKLIDSTEKVMEHVDEVVEDVGGFVRSVTGLRTVVGAHTEYNFSNQFMKTYFTLRLQPKEDKYYLIEIIDDPRGKVSQTSEVIRTTDPDEAPLIKEDRTKVSQTLKFSLEFAKRYYFVTGRFGLIENTGGLGLDFEFWKDRIKFSFDLFDFGKERYPQLKSLAMFYPISNFFIIGGVTDIFNTYGRDYFIGGGIAFTDDDLKSILLIAPSPQ